ncbi:MAG: hypothetical protein HY332_23850 [Chloroflexi bacterium]|nr:hypothetical protein [Chloroflexota bacterium]
MTSNSRNAFPHNGSLVAAQVWPHSLLDEGIDAALDVLQHIAGANTICLVTANRGTPSYKAARWAPGHRERLGPRTVLGGYFSTPHPELYPPEALPPMKTPQNGLQEIDALAWLLEAAQARDLAVYAYLFDAYYYNPPEALSPAMATALSVDALGRPRLRPCYNNPRYRGFILGMIEDHVRSYEAAGLSGVYFQFEGFGASSPFQQLFYGQAVPACFCEHCAAQAAAKGWSAERARDGYLRAHELIHSANRDSQGGGDETALRPRDGYLVTLFRLLIRYPEILAWQSLWQETRGRMFREIYGVAKSLVPSQQVAFNIHHSHQMELFHRASFDYAEVREFADWIKPNVFHRVAGPRFARNVRALQRGLFRDWQAEQVRQLLYEAFGFGGPNNLDELTARGFPPEEFVYHETRRIVEAAGPGVPVCPGIDLEAPGSPSTEPDDVEASIEQAFRAGARGIVLSRFYDEWSLPTLEAVGRAVRRAVQP